MSAKHIFLLYSQNSGLEITPEIKVNTGKGQSEGRVQLRFFLLQSPGAVGKTTQIKFLMEPWEAFDLALKMDKIFREGGKEKLTHKFTPAGGQEVVTSLTVEKWERADKSGLGVALGRGDSFISVPVGKDNISRFLYAAEFLKYLSTQQQWVDRNAA